MVQMPCELGLFTACLPASAQVGKLGLGFSGKAFKEIFGSGGPSACQLPLAGTCSPPTLQEWGPAGGGLHWAFSSRL